MTEPSATSVPSAPARPRAARVRRGLGDVLGPIYRAVVADPVREGRLRLDGAGALERQLAIVGLLVLIGLMASLLAPEAWREGRLVALNSAEGRWRFVPEPLLPVTLIALSVGWVVFLWGAVRASLPVRLGAAALFLLLNSTIGRPVVAQVSDALALRWGEPLARTGYFAAAGVLVLYSLVASSERWGRRARPAVLAGVVLSVAALFGAQLWVHVAEVQAGIPDTPPGLVDSAIQQIAFMSQPMILIAAVALIDFSYALAEAATLPARAWRPSAVRLGVLALVGVKLWIQVGRHAGEWADRLRTSPLGIVSVAVALVLFAAVWLAARRSGRGRATTEQVERAKEALMYGGIAAWAVPALLFSMLLSLATAVLVQTHWLGAFRLISRAADAADRLPVYTRGALAALLLVLGVALLARRRGGELRREVGLGLVVLGAFNLPFYVLAALNHRLPFNEHFLDVLVTAGAGAAVLAGWRRLSSGQVAALGAVVLFSWLVMTKGDFVAIAGSLAGLPQTVLLVFGVTYSLLADSALASGDGRHVPRNARLLMWVGYLVLSGAILNWVAATHGTDLAATVAESGFFTVGLPLAAWLVIRRPPAPAPPEG